MEASKQLNIILEDLTLVGGENNDTFFVPKTPRPLVQELFEKLETQADYSKYLFSKLFIVFRIFMKYFSNVLCTLLAII